MEHFKLTIGIVNEVNFVNSDTIRTLCNG